MEIDDGQMMLDSQIGATKGLKGSDEVDQFSKNGFVMPYDFMVCKNVLHFARMLQCCKVTYCSYYVLLGEPCVWNHLLVSAESGKHCNVVWCGFWMCGKCLKFCQDVAVLQSYILLILCFAG